ncbi:Aminomethyltransferase [bacterium HR21]|jgi:folate-binding protein YgfZ|nr:Aminomethyltransferase [bacterium HR21]
MAALLWFSTAFDILCLEGPDALDFLNRMSTAELAHLPVGESRATVFTTEKGRIREVAIVVQREAGTLEVVCPAGRGESLLGWLQRFRFLEQLRLSPPQVWDGSELHGSGGGELLRRLGVPLPTQHHWGAGGAAFWRGIPLRCFWIPAYSGGEAYRILLPRGHGDQLRAALQEVLGEPSTADQVEAARILAGQGKPGAEWSEEYNPFEVGLGELVSLSKGCYIGQEVLARLETYGKVQRCLLRFQSREPIPVPAALSVGQQRIGTITSAAPVAELAGWVALGVVRREWMEAPSFTAETPEGRQIVLQRYGQ